MPRTTRWNPSRKRKRTTTNSDAWESAFALFRREASAHPSPSLNVLHDTGSSPWQILVSTILSLRTRDEVTLAASRRVFAVAHNPATTRALDEDSLAALAFPAAFYKTKARQIRTIAQQLEARGDQLPSTRNELLAYPGVGPKTANLVLNLGFGIRALCVDTHVHRIPNRLGWIATGTPEASEKALTALWPERHWIEANALLVSFGQQTCTPVSPRCSRCPFRGDCKQVGVTKTR